MINQPQEDPFITASRLASDEAVWDLSDVALFFRCARETARKSIVTQEGFPEPLRCMKNRYYAKEVKQFAFNL